MTNEELLKAISEMLKKHTGYLGENPEVFAGIQSRLLKAIDYEEFADQLPDEDEFEDDDAAKWLAAQEEGGDQQEEEPDQEEMDDADTATEQDKAPSGSKVSNSGYREWAPKDSYEDHHAAAIKEHMDQGFSHREAERFAGAHDAPANFQEALKHKIKPSHPSDAYFDLMRDHAKAYLQNAERVEGENADATKNPQKYASHKAITAHREVHKDFNDSYNKFLQSDDIKGLKGRERHKAIKQWKDDWHAENSDHREKAIAAADAGKGHFEEAHGARAKALEDSEMALLHAGKAGAEGTVDSSSAAQLIGGKKGEAGYEAGTSKDPNAIFAEQNPEYIESLKQKMLGKLKNDPEMQSRHAAIESFRQPQQPKNQPAPVKSIPITQEMRDKYETKGNK